MIMESAGMSAAMMALKAIGKSPCFHLQKLVHVLQSTDPILSWTKKADSEEYSQIITTQHLWWWFWREITIMQVLMVLRQLVTFSTGDAKSLFA
jgi:hypothetical protein